MGSIKKKRPTLSSPKEIITGVGCKGLGVTIPARHWHFPISHQLPFQVFNDDVCLSSRPALFRFPMVQWFEYSNVSGGLIQWLQTQISVHVMLFGLSFAHFVQVGRQMRKVVTVFRLLFIEVSEIFYRVLVNMIACKSRKNILLNLRFNKFWCQYQCTPSVLCFFIYLFSVFIFFLHLLSVYFYFFFLSNFFSFLFTSSVCSLY